MSSLTLKDLDLSKRALNLLDNMEVHTLEQLIARSILDLQRYRNCGAKTIIEIKFALSEHGIQWGEGISAATSNQAVRAKIQKIDREIKRLRELKFALLSEPLEHPSTKKRENADARRKKAFEMKQAGKTFREIGLALGVSPARARQIFLDYLP